MIMILYISQRFPVERCSWTTESYI